MLAKSIKVLLIEDNPGDARLISEMLKDAKDFSFDLAHSDSVLKGKEYLSQNGPDVILLDLSLPDSSGLETLLFCPRTDCNGPYNPYDRP